MSRFVHEGNTLIWWATSVSNKDAPTVAEIAAATEISAYVPKDGLTVPATQNMVDNATIRETFDAQGVGSYGGSLSLTGFRDTTDTFWNLCVYGTVGYLIVRRGLPVGTAVAAAQKVEVYPAQMHQPVPTQSAANEQVKFTEMLAATSAPSLKATVAA